MYINIVADFFFMKINLYYLSNLLKILDFCKKNYFNNLNILLILPNYISHLLKILDSFKKNYFNILNIVLVAYLCLT